MPLKIRACIAASVNRTMALESRYALSLDPDRALRA